MQGAKTREWRYDHFRDILNFPSKLGERYAEIAEIHCDGLSVRQRFIRAHLREAVQ